MPHSMTLPLVAGLAVIGAATGVSLGRSAIAEINPAYFGDPETAFHADLSPYRGPDWAQVQAAEYQQQASPEGLGTGCVGCTRMAAVYLPDPVGWSDGQEDGRAASAAYADAAPPPAEVAPRDPELERIERYASYRVAEEVPAQEEAEGEAMLVAAATE